MGDFSQALHDWELFYSTVALASVTLVGLLFVSLSIRLEAADAGDYRNVVGLARGSFADFLYLLMLGLVFLAPHPAPIGLAVALFVLGTSRAVGMVRQAASAYRRRTAAPPAGRVVRAAALPFIASFGLVAVAWEVMRGDLVALYGLVLVVAALLTRASWNAWLILVDPDRHASDGPAANDGVEPAGDQPPLG